MGLERGMVRNLVIQLDSFRAGADAHARQRQFSVVETADTERI
jgi:hypothetical protein